MQELHTECKVSVTDCLLDSTMSIGIGPKKLYADIHNYRDLVTKNHDFMLVSIIE